MGAYIWCDFAGIAKILLGREAIPWSRRSVEANRLYPMARFHYAAAPSAGEPQTPAARRRKGSGSC
jgi:hypothetical protein